MADTGKGWTSSKLRFLLLCFHRRITTHIYPPSAQVTIHSHSSLPIVAFALCTSKYSHIPSSPLSQATPSVTLPSTTSENNTPRYWSIPQTSKVSAQAFVAFPGHSVLLLNTGAASFFAKGNWHGQKERNLQQSTLLNFL